MSDKLTTAYDRIFQEFFVDCEMIGEAMAIEIARERMRKLGLENREINQQLAEALQP